MAKVNVDDLPTLDDFTESKLAVKENTPPPADDDNNPDPDGDDEDGKDGKGKKPDAKKPEVKKPDPKKPAAPAPADKNKPGDKSGKPAPAKPKAQAPVQSEEGKDGDEDPDPDNDDGKTPAEDEGSFWDDVQKITGIELEVDFGEVDPESPQGAAIRDQALAEHVVDNYIKTLQQKFPRAYKILEHEANGGKIEDLLTPNYIDYSKIELKEENKEQQKQVLLDYYIKDKGFDPKKAQRMVEADEDSEEGLFTQAQAALKEKVDAQKAYEEKVTKETKLKQQAREAQDGQFLGSVKNIVAAGKVGNFNILTKKDKEEFYAFVENSLQRGGDDGYVAVLPVDKENIAAVLQQLYFGFKGGNLENFIQRTAETANVRRLQRKVAASTKVTSGEENKQTPGKQLPTFADFTETD